VEDYFEVLTNLRNAGTMNMFGAPKWLQETYGLTREEAMEIFRRWTETFEP
jgi:hypothetical protein